MAWHQIRMWWHTVAINICRQMEKEKSLQWSSEAICYTRKRRLSPYLMSFTLGLLCRYSGYICTLKQSELPFTVWNNCIILLNVGGKRRIKVRKSFFEQKCCAVSLGFLGLSQVSAKLLVIVPSSWGMAGGCAVSSKAVVILSIPTQSVLYVPWGKERHSLITGKVISTSTAVHTAGCSFRG